MSDVKDLPVLIVDDDPHVGRCLALHLRNGGYSHVHPVTSGAEAMAFASDNRLLAVILDIHLPDLHGLILSQQLRTLCGPAMPILVLSGDSAMSILNSLPLAGATYYFSKPVEPAKLLRRLEESLREQADGGLGNAV